MRQKPSCKGCGAQLIVEVSGPEKASVFHPEPLCAHVLALIEGGIASGPIVPASVDRETGEVTEDPRGTNN